MGTINVTVQPNGERFAYPANEGNDGGAFCTLMHREHGEGSLLPSPSHRLPPGEYIYALRTAGRSVRYQPYAGYGSCQGLNNTHYMSQRDPTVDSLLRLLQNQPLLMLNGPPKSGVTSLLELLFRKAVVTGAFEQVIHVRLAATSGNIEAALRKQGVFMADLRSGSRKLLILDDAQLGAQGNHGFWTLAGTLHAHPAAGPSRLSIIIGYMNTPRAPAQGGNNHLSDPGRWDPSAVVSTHTTRTVGASLGLELEEYRELTEAFRTLKWTDALTTPGLFGRLKTETDARVGLVCGVFDLASTKLRLSPFVQGSFDGVVNAQLGSEKLFSFLDQHFESFLDSEQAFSRSHIQLLRHLLLDKDHRLRQTESPALWNVGLQLWREGFLVRGQAGGVDFITFASPLHCAFFRRLFHTFRLPRIENTLEACEDLLVYGAERMDPNTLAKSLGVTAAGDLREDGYEVEFSGGVKSCTADGDVVVSNQVGMKWKKKRGRIDITATLRSGELFGIELIRDTDNPFGHHERFISGPYRKLNLKQWAILDFRHPGCTAPLPDPWPSNYYVIQFEDSYKKAWLLRPDGSSMQLFMYNKEPQ